MLIIPTGGRELSEESLKFSLSVSYSSQVFHNYFNLFIMSYELALRGIQ